MPRVAAQSNSPQTHRSLLPINLIAHNECSRLRQSGKLVERISSAEPRNQAAIAQNVYFLQLSPRHWLQLTTNGFSTRNSFH